MRFTDPWGLCEANGVSYGYNGEACGWSEYLYLPQAPEPVISNADAIYILFGLLDAVDYGSIIIDIATVPSGECLIVLAATKGIREGVKKLATKLSKWEIDKLIKHGIHPHDLKPGDHKGLRDLYKDADGNIYEGAKGTRDVNLMEPTGYNINDFK
ncbi:MAG: polymorphic toxin type 33 domain-containing protein [Deltaproteobacteria bacterium]|nr:polymorphic toxin type 33 domain-containing protein [Deltaproteobacteria bacterium]